jgi:hypothetical protein
MPAGTATATKPRVRKSPAEKATEALAVAEARHERAVKAAQSANDALAAANAELARSQQLVGYARQHPDLPQAEPVVPPQDVAVSDG